MSTRSGAHYHSSPSHLEPTMDNETGSMLRTITEQLAQITASLNQLGGRVQVLEDIRSNPVEPVSPHPHYGPGLPSDSEVPLHAQPDLRRPIQHDRGYIPREPQYRDLDRRPHPDDESLDDRAIRNVRLDAPTFDGSLDPKMYEDWEGDMDQYFDWYDMSEGRKFKFAKTRLVRHARLYWGNLELLIR